MQCTLYKVIPAPPEFPMCTNDAQYRVGFRCTKGCNGEGIFEYICAEQIELYTELTDNISIASCTQCKAKLELFPLQMIG